MFCKYCGKSIGSDSLFCPFCGKSLADRLDENNVEQSNTQSKELTQSDFIVEYDSQKIDIYEKFVCHKTIYQEFVIGDNIKTKRGIDFNSDYNSVIEKYGESKKYTFISETDTVCFFLNRYPPSEDLKELKRASYLLKYKFVDSNGEFTIRFYFNKFDRLIAVALLNNNDNFFEGKEFTNNVIKFVIGNRTLYFDKRIDNLIDIHSDLRILFESMYEYAIKGIVNPKYVEYHEENGYYEDYQLAEMYDNFFEKSFPILESIYDSAVEEIMNILLLNDIYTISKEKLYDVIKLHGGNCIEELLKEYINIYSEVNDYINELDNQLSYKKASRSRWEGGGFGVKGAIKGAAEASMLNMASDIMHGIGDSATRMRNNRSVIELKARAISKIDFDKLYNTVGRQIILIDFYSIWYLLRDGEDYPKYPENFTADKDKVILNMWNKYNGGKNKEVLDVMVDLILDVIEINPFRPHYYNYLLNIFDGTEHLSEVRNIIDYFEQ